MDFYRFKQGEADQIYSDHKEFDTSPKPNVTHTFHLHKVEKNRTFGKFQM